MQLLIFSLFIWLCSGALDSRWKLMWSDEFSGSAVDTSIWSVRDKAGYGGANDEAEWNAPSQISVSDGKLVIKSEPSTLHSGYQYLSGYMDTMGKWQGTFGRYEVLAKLPRGKGMWPAHWLMQYEQCPTGEIDIMENIGYDIAVGTLHYASGCNDGKGNGTEYTTPFNLNADYHTYAIEWHPNNITWYVDSYAYKTVYDTSLDNGKPFPITKSPHYWILNTAVGGPNSWPGSPNASTTFPQYHYIDYVRVYGWQPCETGCGANGCCDQQSKLCVCDAGYSGTYCEFYSGASFNTDFYNPPGLLSNGATTNNRQLVLTIKSGCTACVAPTWSITNTFYYGNFTIIAKGPTASSTALLVWATGGTNGMFLGFQLSLEGQSRTQINIQSFTFNATGIPLGFDHSLAFHNYTIAWTAKAYRLYVDGTYKATLGSPDVPLQMKVEIQQSTQYFGPVVPSALPSTAYVSWVSWTNQFANVAHKPCPAPTTSTTISAATTAKSSTTTSLSTTTKPSTTSPSFTTASPSTTSSPSTLSPTQSTSSASSTSSSPGTSSTRSASSSSSLSSTSASPSSSPASSTSPSAPTTTGSPSDQNSAYGLIFSVGVIVTALFVAIF